MAPSTAGSNQAKGELRKSAKALLATISPEERAAAGERAASLVVSLGAYRLASLVLAFLAMPSEIDTGPVIDAALAAGKRVAAPRIEGDDIAFVELAPGWRLWPRDRWDIPAPPAAISALSLEAIAAAPSLALVPGLAFDRSGGRLGRGRGYYDRFLAGLEGARAALGPSAPAFTALAFGYRAQLVAAVPTDERDRPLDGLALV